MSQSDTYQIKCECGNIIVLTLYHSVNVSVDPSLRGKVSERKINNYKCDRCGAQNELAYEFLYNDMDRSRWIFVMPMSLENKREEITKQKIDEWERSIKHIKIDIGLKEPLVVFGYDELFGVIGLNKTIGKEEELAIKYAKYISHAERGDEVVGQIERFGNTQISEQEEDYIRIITEAFCYLFTHYHVGVCGLGNQIKDIDWKKFLTALRAKILEAHILFGGIKSRDELQHLIDAQGFLGKIFSDNLPNFEKILEAFTYLVLAETKSIDQGKLSKENYDNLNLFVKTAFGLWMKEIMSMTKQDFAS